ncbi:MAG: arginine--tRNA ligase [Alistipes sp.]|jgi:arginyl-tRNA synthetase|nr:arginine--tRNA ligase [Alistipes sp.]
MNIEQKISTAALEAVGALYGVTDAAAVQIQKTRKEFAGDYTLVVFPLLKASRKSPDATATEIGEYIAAHNPDVEDFNVIKGFLNISLRPAFWAARFDEIVAAGESFGRGAPTGRTVMVEYSSPNTNKPLHLGHVRNNLLGWSVAEIMRACGHNVLKANLVNDRGIHICKSMLAWQRFGNGETPQSSGLKGDHLVGKYYVIFNDELKKDESLMTEAQEMLRKWEAHDPEVYKLWETMNGWVYDGFEATYKRLGVDFDRMYYESQTYLLGKALVEEGLAKGVFYRRDDGSVWCDLTADGLDEKLLLRSDGTSVYMTQDLGTAYRRFEDENLDGLIYVVGNEQNYHFQVLKLLIAKLDYTSWADAIYHLSYGMVELPEGKMKSREGTVVDADDLVEGMVETAREMSAELGKLDGLSPDEAAQIAETVGLGALKYFILKVDPRKTMLFDPRESIDFNGNTGPFIQYTHARIRSVLRKAEEAGTNTQTGTPATCLPEELEIIKMLSDYPAVVAAAGENYAPSLIAAYTYDLAKLYNSYYHDHSILRENDEAIRAFRLRLSAQVAAVIKKAMWLLGITVPERM